MKAPFLMLALRNAGEANALRSRLRIVEQERDAAQAVAAERLVDVIAYERQVRLLMSTCPSDLRELAP